MKTIGQALREARTTHNLSQTDLASKIGVSQVTVSNWERNLGAPDEERRTEIEKLVGALDAANEGDEGDEGDVEGIDSTTDGGLGEYPLDSLMIRNEPRSVHEVLRRATNGQIILDPDFQRAFVWDSERQSRLIESALLRIPLPVMYFAENPDGKLVVVDGLQRLTTFKRFVGNELALDLRQGALNKKRFADLEPRLQTRVEDTPLILYIIDSKVPEKVRLDIFERVNGGVALSRQQMRNALYNGKGTRWLRDRVSSPDFQGLFSPKNLLDLQTSMRDRELANRFAAFRLLGWTNYRGDMDAFLGEALRKLNSLADGDRDALTKEFDDGIANTLSVFDRMAFRRHHKGQTRRSPFNAALFDVLSATLCRYSRQRVDGSKELIRCRYFELEDQEDFKLAISYGTNQRDRVTTRFTLLQRKLKGVLGDP